MIKKILLVCIVFVSILFAFDDDFFDDLEPTSSSRSINQIVEEDPFEKAQREKEEAQYQKRVEKLNQYYKDSVSKLNQASKETAKIDREYQKVSNKDYDLQQEEQNVKNYEIRVKRQQKRLDQQMYAQERRKDKQMQNALYQNAYTSAKQSAREGLQRAEQERERIKKLDKVLYSEPTKDYSKEPITIQVDSDLLSNKKARPTKFIKDEQVFKSNTRKDTISFDDIDNDLPTSTKIAKTKKEKKPQYKEHIEAIAFYWKVKRSGLEKKYMSTGEYKGDGPVQKSTGIAETLDEKIANSGCTNYRKKVAYSQDGKDGFIFYCNSPLQSYDRNIANTQNISDSYILNERKKYKCIKNCMWSSDNKTRMNKCCKEY
jgi:hypothetical protein